MKKIKKIRLVLLFFMIVLFLSGLTAIPIETELRIILKFVSNEKRIVQFLTSIYNGVLDTKAKYPFLMYGYDWLAFAHFVLAILFIGPYKNPIKNKWVIEFGLIACALIIPFALISGHFREIPVYWRLIDCSFGVFGAIPLYYCLYQIKKLEKNEK